MGYKKKKIKFPFAPLFEQILLTRDARPQPYSGELNYFLKTLTHIGLSENFPTPWFKDNSLSIDLPGYIKMTLQSQIAFRLSSRVIVTLH